MNEKLSQKREYVLEYILSALKTNQSHTLSMTEAICHPKTDSILNTDIDDYWDSVKEKFLEDDLDPEDFYFDINISVRNVEAEGDADIKIDGENKTVEVYWPDIKKSYSEITETMAENIADDIIEGIENWITNSYDCSIDVIQKINSLKEEAIDEKNESLVNKHGLVMEGLEDASIDTSGLYPGCNNYVQISYNTDTGKVLSEFDTASSRVVYHNKAIISVKDAYLPMTMQEIADAIAHAVES